MTKPLCGAIAIALIAVVPAGCGSSDKSSSDKAPTKAAFLKKGNGICKAGSKEIDAKGKAIFKGKPSPAQQVKFVKQVLIPSVQKQVTGVGNLTPPKGDESKVNAIVSSANGALKKAHSNPKLMLSDSAFAKTNKLANAYGLKACGGS